MAPDADGKLAVAAYRHAVNRGQTRYMNPTNRFLGRVERGLRAARPMRLPQATMLQRTRPPAFHCECQVQSRFSLEHCTLLSLARETTWSGSDLHNAGLPEIACAQTVTQGGQACQSPPRGYHPQSETRRESGPGVFRSNSRTARPETATILPRGSQQRDRIQPATSPGYD